MEVVDEDESSLQVRRSLLSSPPSQSLVRQKLGLLMCANANGRTRDSRCPL